MLVGKCMARSAQSALLLPCAKLLGNPLAIIAVPASTQERSRLASVAASEAENKGLHGVCSNSNAQAERGPVDSRVILLSKDAEKVPGQHQSTS